MRTVLVFACFCAVAAAADIRLGIIGTDTSHVVVFTQVFNDPARPDHIPGVRVVAAYKGGSPDIDASWSRVDKFAGELQTKWNISFEPDIPALCARVDAILLETNDGRKHLEQARQVIAARKPIFIDKPLASTLEDAREIARLAREAGVPFFSSSSARFAGIGTAMKFPDTQGAMVWGPGPLEPHHYMDLSWYAIHPIELLYTLMGPGCDAVSRTSTKDADEIVGHWKDGRIGSVRANRPHGAQGAVVFRANNKIAQSDKSMVEGYGPMLKEIVKFFQTGKPPVQPEETLEIMAFMDAAQRSKEAGGKPMQLR
jgi:hypothetical protein